jgi:hypothetical protein
MNNSFLTPFSFYYFIKFNNMTFLLNYFAFLIYEKQYKKIKFDKKRRRRLSTKLINRRNLSYPNKFANHANLIKKIKINYKIKFSIN